MASNSPDQVHPADDRAPPPATHDTAGYPPRDNSQPRDQPRRAPMDAPEGPPFKLWVGGFRLETQQEQVREAFGRFGAITHCWYVQHTLIFDLKYSPARRIARNPPGFGYIVSFGRVSKGGRQMLHVFAGVRYSSGGTSCY